MEEEEEEEVGGEEEEDQNICFPYVFLFQCGLLDRYSDLGLWVSVRGNFQFCL